MASLIHVLAHDQEPLNWNQYDYGPSQIQSQLGHLWPWNICNAKTEFWEDICKLNLATRLVGTMHDKIILLHSEMNSIELARYQESGWFVPCYWWSHAMIARDWYRFAQFDPRLRFDGNQKYQFDFNVYCRAWTGTREYRLKFLEIIQEQNLIDNTRITFLDRDPEPYQSYIAYNRDFLLNRPLSITPCHNVSSDLSACYDAIHYHSCAFDVVLETLFDDTRWHLTEKILRPIACGKPFLLAAPAGSLEYLKLYGFKTFSPWINEHYDQEPSPLARLQLISQEMRRIAGLPQEEKHRMVRACHEIAQHNRNLFFSQSFSRKIVDELTVGLMSAIDQIEKNPGRGKLLCGPSSLLTKPTRRKLYKELGITPQDRIEQIRTVRMSRNRQS